jgi:hypothetical protein
LNTRGQEIRRRILTGGQEARSYKGFLFENQLFENPTPVLVASCEALLLNLVIS